MPRLRLRCHQCAQFHKNRCQLEVPECRGADSIARRNVRCSSRRPEYLSFSMTNKNKPNLTCLQEYLQVDPTSPSGLRWKKSNGAAKAGSVAGAMDIHGYWRVGFNYKLLMTSRVVLELSGFPPPFSKAEADHINGDRNDNRLENLQWLTRTANNRKRVTPTPYGYKYVQNSHRKAKPFAARFYLGGKAYNCGRHASAYAAHLAALAKRLEVSWI